MEVTLLISGLFLYTTHTLWKVGFEDAAGEHDAGVIRPHIMFLATRGCGASDYVTGVRGAKEGKLRKSFEDLQDEMEL